MLNTNNNKRYSGYIKLMRKCEKLKIEMEFDLVFSAILEKINDKGYKMSLLNPYQLINSIEKYKTVYIIFPEDKSTRTGKFKIKEKKGEYLLLDLIEMRKDQRLFFRFHFCCRDLGNFIIKKGSKIISEDSCVYEISKKGLGIYCFSDVNLKEGDTIDIISVEDEFSLKLMIKHFKKRGIYSTFGGEILETDINLINYIIRKYIKVSEEIILKMG